MTTRGPLLSDATPRRGLARALPGGAAVSLALLSLLAVPSPRRARADDVEPVPPVVFLPADAESKEEIEEVFTAYFGDVTKAARGRDLLVKRYGLVAAPALVERVEAATNEAETWNAALALGALRRAYGPSHLLWPAIRPLTRLVKSPSRDLWTRVFAALALGEFHGPEGVRRSPSSREGNEGAARQAREALVEAEAALVEGLADSRWEVGTACALALAKTGGSTAASRVVDVLRTGGSAAPLETREATLVALALLSAPDDDRFAKALKDGERRLRRSGALAVSCWAVSELVATGPAAPGSAALTRAAGYEPLLVAASNAQLRMGEEDGAEATYARGALALLSGRTATWEELFALAKDGSTEREVAVAAAQDLLFAPPEAGVRARMADLAGRRDIGRSLKEPVLAAFLVVAGTDGTVDGVRTCREYLRNKAKSPAGRLEWDVRYFAATGLVRAYQAGRVELAARADAAESLTDGAHANLPVGEEGSFRSVLEAIAKPVKAALAGPDAMLPPEASALLEATFVDPDAMLAHDPVDTALSRLNKVVVRLFHVEALPAAAVGPIDHRKVNREDQPQRLLYGWLSKHPYFTRLDFHRERGRVPAAAAPGRDPALELPR